MTRETKLGLVAVGAFVSLLTVVVYYKLRENNNAAQEPAQVGRSEFRAVAPKKIETPPADPLLPPPGVPNTLPYLTPAPLPPSASTVPAIAPPVPDTKSAMLLPPDTVPLPMNQSTVSNIPLPDPKTPIPPGSGHPRQQLAVELPKFGDTDTLPVQPMQPVSPAQAEANRDKNDSVNILLKEQMARVEARTSQQGGPVPAVYPAIPAERQPDPTPTSAGAKLLPFVTVTEVELYSCKPEDKSFIDLSNRHYRSDKYAQALLKFNRDGSGTAPGILREPPLLEAGMVVQIPPVSKLDENYPDLILKSLTAVPSFPNAPPPPPGLLPDSVPLTNATVPMTPVPPANVQARPGE